MKPGTRNFFRYYGPALLWTVAIFFFSTNTFSSEQTGSVLRWLMLTFFGRVEGPELALLHFLIRKSAHLVVYFLLSLLWFRARRGPRAGWRREWALAAVLVSMLVAGSDEIHQLFVPSRAGNGWDVLLDSFAALLAQAFLVWRSGRRPQTPV